MAGLIATSLARPKVAVQTVSSTRLAILQRIQGLSQPYAEHAHSHFEPLRGIVDRLQVLPMRTSEDEREVNEAFLAATHHLMDKPVSISSELRSLTPDQWQTIYHRARHLTSIRQHLEDLRTMDMDLQACESSGSKATAGDAMTTLSALREDEKASKAVSSLSVQLEKLAEADGSNGPNVHDLEAILSIWKDIEHDNVSADTQATSESSALSILDRVLI